MTLATMMTDMRRHHPVPEVYLKAFFFGQKVAANQHVLRVYQQNSKVSAL